VESISGRFPLSQLFRLVWQLVACRSRESDWFQGHSGCFTAGQTPNSPEVQSGLRRSVWRSRIWSEMQSVAEGDFPRKGPARYPRVTCRQSLRQLGPAGFSRTPIKVGILPVERALQVCGGGTARRTYFAARQEAASGLLPTSSICISCPRSGWIVIDPPVHQITCGLSTEEGP